MCIFVPNATVLSEVNALGMRFSYWGHLRFTDFQGYVFTQGL